MAASDFLKVVQEVRGTEAPGAPRVDGIYHDIAEKLTESDGTTPRLGAGMYGSTKVMYEESADVRRELYKLIAVYDIIDDITVAAENMAILDVVVNPENLSRIVRVADDLNAVDENYIADITYVAEDLYLGEDSKIITLSSMRAVLEELHNRKLKLDSLYADKATLDSLYVDKATLDSLYADKPALDSLYADKITLDEVYSRKEAIDSLYLDKSTLDSLYADKIKLDSLFADKAILDSLFGDKAILDSLYADKDKLDSLYADKNTLDVLYATKASIDSLFTDKAILDSLYSDKITLDSLFADKATLDSLFADKVSLDRVYSSIDNVDRVTDSISAVDTVSDAIVEVNRVALSIDNVDIAAANIANINIVADVTNLANITTIADDLNSMDLNGIADVTIVANDLVLGEGVSSVLRVSADLPNVDIVSADIVDVSTVAEGISAVTISAGSIDSINTTAANIADINTVSSINTDVVTVASIDTAITSLYNDKAILDSLYADKATLDSLVLDKETLDSIFADKIKLDSVYADKSTIDSIYADKLKLDSLYSDKETLDSLFNDKTTLDSLFSDKVALTSIFNDKVALDSLYADKSTLDRLHTSIDNLDRVFTSVDNLDRVFTSIDNIDTVISDVVNIDIVAANIIDVNNAEENANIAIDKALDAISAAQEDEDVNTNVHTLGVASATSEFSAKHYSAKAAADAVQTALDRIVTSSDLLGTNADVVATNADVVLTHQDVEYTSADVNTTNANVLLTNADVVATHVDAASTAQDSADTNADLISTNANVVLTNADVVTTNNNVILTNNDLVAATAAKDLAETANSNAQAALLATASILDTFDDRMLGAFATEPTLDNDGNALVAGTIFYDTTVQSVKFYNGASWDDPDTVAATSAQNASDSAAAALASELSAEADATQTALDRVATGEDVISTNADAVQTALDRIATNQDTLDTAADLVQTAQDVIIVNAARDAAIEAQGLAESARDEAAASADFVDDLVLGSKDVAPTTDNDGNDLQVGAIYYDTSIPGSGQLKIWDGSEWDNAVFNATGAVLTFNGREGYVSLSTQDIETALGFTVVDVTVEEKYQIATNAANIEVITTAMAGMSDASASLGSTVEVLIPIDGSLLAVSAYDIKLQSNDTSIFELDGSTGKIIVKRPGKYSFVMTFYAKAIDKDPTITPRIVINSNAGVIYDDTLALIKVKKDGIILPTTVLIEVTEAMLSSGDIELDMEVGHVESVPPDNQVAILGFDAIASTVNGVYTGFADHSQLTGTFDVDSHPIAAITNLQPELDSKVDKNAAISAGTGTKVTYDSKGLVTGSDTAQASEVPSASAGNLTSTTVQEALEELQGDIDNIDANIGALITGVLA